MTTLETLEERVKHLEREVDRLAATPRGINATTQGWNGETLVLRQLTLLVMDYLNPLRVESPARWLWIDSTGDLRIHTAAPTADGDGTVVGTQT
jgi:hypothetical protein